MHDVLPLLPRDGFPAIRRRAVTTLQVNLGYRCNQSCVHCHVGAGPNRTEAMDRPTVELVLRYLEEARVGTLDLTGGAPELNPLFRELVVRARALGVRVIDRCNLTILMEPGQEDLAAFLAEQRVEVTASLPCYLEDNVDAQRGKGVFAASIRALQRLNSLGYGAHAVSADAGDPADPARGAAIAGDPAGPAVPAPVAVAASPGLVLNLVYNPQGPVLPPAQAALEADYRRMLGERYGIRFTRLYALANMPIQRFGSALVSKGGLDAYLALLRGAHRDENLESVMCRDLLSVDWQGFVYDCDFNQMLGLPLRAGGRARSHLRELLGADLAGNPVAVRGHCFGCTAGQGSSCGGALDAPALAVERAA